MPNSIKYRVEMEHRVTAIEDSCRNITGAIYDIKNNHLKHINGKIWIIIGILITHILFPQEFDFKNLILLFN